jgi:hypothetical protein
MTTNATTAAPLVTRILHLPITSDAEAFVTVARATERAVVHLGTPGFESRGGLARFLVRGIETELGRLGAAPPGWQYDDGLEAILGDQLYRARLLGCFGLALSLPSLRDLADADGQLGSEDSETLRRLVALAECEPLQLYLPRPCADLRITGNPEPLSAWLPQSLEPGRVASIEYDDPSNGSSESDAVWESTPNALLTAPQLDAFLYGRAEARVETPAAPSARYDETPVPPSVDTPSSASASVLDDETPMPPGFDTPSTPPESAWADETPIPPSAYAQTHAVPVSVPDLGDPPDLRVHTPPLPTVPSVEPQRLQRCLTWATQLGSMNGPKVHGSIEKAFITAYLPLCREIASGAAPTEAAAAAERWAEGFAQGYASAFRQLGTGARRPRMVKDVVDVSVRWLGQYRARQCQLLLVSAMRFDLAQRLNEELEGRFGAGAVCADQCMLWAALPSNAEAQRLGGHEAAALRRASGEMPSAPAGGRAIVPFNVGNRGLFKLDHVPSELERTGEAEPARLGRLAVELADSIEPWMREQPPETLIVLFGDHGFHWQASLRGTGAAQRGGALPEQVLVSASAWLLREPRHKARVAPGIH